MEITVAIFLVLLAAAFICEFIDSSLGMGYGTVLTPLLLVMGFDPLAAVPAVLLSQAFGGLSAAYFHQQFENVSFDKNSRNFKIVLMITGLGLAATITAAVISVNIPRVYLKSYIGILVLIMGVIILRNQQFSFSWKKIIGVGILGAFNKGISGGGFGPVLTGGQILSGQDHKEAIGVTTLSEVPICTAGFFTYLITRTILEINEPVLKMPVADFFEQMFSPAMFQWELLLALVLGSVLVTPFGAFTTRIIKKEKMQNILGILLMILGLWTLYKVWM